MKSIRVFLVAVILATITLSNFLAALQGYQSSMREAELAFDNQLLETAELIANIHSESAVTSIDHASNTAFQVWRNGEIKVLSSNAPVTAIAPLSPGFDYNNFNGYRWRTVGHYDQTNNYWVLVAERMDLRYTLAENVVLESILPILMAIPVIGLLVWFVVGRGLMPLRSLAQELGTKQAGDLSPLGFDAPKRELEQIVLSTNVLLGRLESSLAREKQFAADAAHELRTPISALKVQLYNIARELPDGDEAVEQLTVTVDRLGHLVEQILALYKTAPDQYITQFTEIDLHSLIQDVVAQEYGQFESKQQTLEYRGEPCTILGDQFSLTTLVENLLSNASKYTPNGGRIDVSVREGSKQITLTVEDSGPGIAPEHRNAVFERFYRVGGDRHSSGEPGCGLGLAIVKHIADLHGASIAITASSFASGSAVSVVFSKINVFERGSNKQPGL